MKVTRTVLLLLAAVLPPASAAIINIESPSDLNRFYWGGNILNGKLLKDIYVTPGSGLGWVSHPIITSLGGVNALFYSYEPGISMTFDGSGSDVYEVHRYGKIRFESLESVTFKNIHNKYFALFGGALSGTVGGYGGVLNGTDGGIATDGGIVFRSISSVTLDNICYEASQWGTEEAYWVGGGALYTQDGDSVSFSGMNDLTINNVGIRHDSKFALDSGRNFRAYGGAVYTHNMVIENLDDVNVTKNYIYKKYQQGTISAAGGAFHLQDNNYFSNIDEANFIGNNVNVANEADGGAIFVDYEASLTLKDRSKFTFSDNYVVVSAANDDTLSSTPDISARGGAVSLNNEASFLSYNNQSLTFSNNYAKGTDKSGKSKQELYVAGGAVYAMNNASLSMMINDSVIFTGNKVEAYNSGTSVHGVAEGGAIAIGENSTLSLQGNSYVLFEGNQVTGDVTTMRGGAISAGAGSHIDISGNRTVNFINNSVTGGMGSAIYTEGTLYISHGSVTFSGNEGYAVYMNTKAQPTTTGHLVLKSSGRGDILFDGDKLYATSSTSTPFSMQVEGERRVVFRGEGSGATIENGSALISSGTLAVENGASFVADGLNVAAGAALAASGSGNSISGTLTMADAESIFRINLSGANICSRQDDGTFTGNAVVQLKGDWVLEQDGLTFDVLLHDDVTGAGVYQLLELNRAFNQELWTVDNISVTGDVLFSDLRWNADYTKLFYARVGDEGHAGDRTWTNLAGSGNWNFNARNWKLTGTEYDGILYVDSVESAPVGVHFTDECTSADDVSITTVVNPRDITVNATRDYTFADGGGKITGSASLIKNGSGTLTIALNNDFTGTAEKPGVDLNEGTIRVQADTALGTGAVQTADGTTLIYENNVTSTLGTSGTYIAGNIEVKEGSSLTIDLGDDSTYNAKTQIIDGTLKFVGSGKKIGGKGYENILSGTGTLLVEGDNLNICYKKVDSFCGDVVINGHDNTMWITNSYVNGSSDFTLNGPGNRLELYDKYVTGTTTVRETLIPFMLTEGGSLNMHGGSTIKAEKVLIGDGAVMTVSGKGNTIETNFDPYNAYNNVLWLGENATLDMTISAENALSSKNDEAVLNTPFLLTYNKMTGAVPSAESVPYNLFVRADMGSAFSEDTSYTLVNLTGGVYFYVGDYNENWNSDIIHVMGDAVFEDLAWSDDYYKLLFNAPDAVIWRDSVGTGVWNTQGDKNWKRFTATDASVFYSGDDVRFTDTCTSEAAVTITERVTPGSILVRADRDYTFVAGVVAAADDGSDNIPTIAGDGKLTKQGKGELTIALNNEFTGGVQLDEGTLRLQADRALGSGKFTMAEGTSLVVENGADVELVTDADEVRGDVTIAVQSALTVSSNSTYAASSTTANGTLQLSGNFKNGSTASLSGNGFIVMNAADGSDGSPVTFDVAKSEGFSGNIIVQEKHNVLRIAEGGYEGGGILLASGQGAEINFEGQDVVIKDSGWLFVNEGGKFVAGNITLSEFATLEATNTDTVFAGNTGMPAMTPMEEYVYELSDCVSSGSIEATNFTMEGGTLYLQNRGFHSLANVEQLVFDGTNGRSITLATTFTPYEEGDMLYYLFFTNVAQYSVNGDMIFYVSDVTGKTEQATLVELENERTGMSTLFLMTKAVPEPTTATLSLLALAALAARRRRC